MNLTVRVDDEPDSIIQKLTLELTSRLAREDGITAQTLQAVPVHGSKGDPVTIGAIVLSAIGSGGVLASLIGVLRSYVERNPKIQFELESAGQKVTIQAEDLSASQLAQTGEVIAKLLHLNT